MKISAVQLAILTLLHTTLYSPSLKAQSSASASAAGHWEGSITLPGTELGIRVDLAQENDTWEGTIDIPVQGLRGFALSEVRIKDNIVSFKMPNIPGDPEFSGTLEPERNKILGSFTQAAQTFPFKIVRAKAAPRKGATPTKGISGNGFAGFWQGSLQQNLFELRILFKLNQTGDELSGTMDSLDQNALNIPITKASANGQELTLEVKSVGGSYTGTLSEDGSEIDGEWSQGKALLPLTIKRLEQAPDISRPQDPVKPYPYFEENITFENRPAEVKLAGTLTYPKSAGPFPAVVLITGSGPQDRDEAIMGHRPFLVLADHLTRKGIAVLRYDDRGVGESTGNFSKALVGDFTSDALAAVKFLMTRKEVDSNKIGLIGHSEGGVVAPQAAVQSKDIAFIVLLAGVGVPLEELLIRQAGDAMRVMGMDQETSEKQAVSQRKIFTILKSNLDHKTSKAAILEVMAKAVEGFTPKELEAMGFNETQLETQASTVLRPWFRDLLQLDPRPTLSQVNCPVLAINGEKDIQVACKENLDGIRAALDRGNNSDITTQAFPNLNHLFQTCETGAITEYGLIEETIAPQVLDTISDWIVKKTE